MGELISLDAARAAKPAVSIQRTPELAFVLAILNALPTKTRAKVLTQVMAIGESKPDCEASQEASFIASSIVLANWKGA